MLKFSTNTNYKIVRGVQVVVCRFISFLGKDVKHISVRRRGVSWSLNLLEVIDFMIFFTGDFDRRSKTVLGRKLKSDDVILDIGGNIGSFCLPMSKLLSSEGKMIVFEPSSYAFNKLKVNVGLNEKYQRRIELVQAFVTNKENESLPDKIYASWNIHSKERHNNHQGVLTTTEGAISVTIDGFVQMTELKRLNWIKIDVDGYEHKVISGAVKTIEKYRPGIFMELCEYSLKEQNSSVESIVQLVGSFGYEFVGLNGKRFGQDIDKIKRLIPEMGTINIFALPYAV